MFPLENLKELYIGRDATTCAIVYDDGVVSRNHAKLVQDAEDPERLMVLDLGSANGTFVNGRAVHERCAVSHGDVVRFGSQGPELRVEFDPPPLSLKRAGPGATPGAEPRDLGATVVEKADEKHWWSDLSNTLSGLGRRRAAGGPGYETRLRALEERDNRTRRVVALALVCASLIVVLVIVLVVDWTAFIPRRMSAEAIASANREAVVRIESAWKALDTTTGGQVFHWHVRNPYIDAGGNWEPIRGIERVPVYVRLANGAVEPVLIPDDERHTNLPIGGQSAGTGFVVHPSGFIVTDRRTAAPWLETYEWPKELPRGIVVDLESRSAALLDEPPRGWVPARARFVINRIPRLEAIVAGEVQGAERVLRGRPDFFQAVLAGGVPRNATLQSSPETSQVALIQVSLAGSSAVRLSKLETPLATGSSLTAFGFGIGSKTPGASLAASAAVVRVTDGKAEGCDDCLAIEAQSFSPVAGGAPLFNERGEVTGLIRLATAGGAVLPIAIPVRQVWRVMGREN